MYVLLLTFLVLGLVAYVFATHHTQVNHIQGTAARRRNMVQFVSKLGDACENSILAAGGDPETLNEPYRQQVLIPHIQSSKPPSNCHFMCLSYDRHVVVDTFNAGNSYIEETDPLNDAYESILKTSKSNGGFVVFERMHPKLHKYVKYLAYVEPVNAQNLILVAYTPV